jgi:hypothetical protein
MRWTGHSARIWEMRDVCKILVCKSDGKKPLRSPRCRWEGNIKTDLREIGLEAVDWINLAKDRGRWLVRINTVMNILIP